MNTNLTEIAFILDRSGSMERLVPQTLRGFNDFLQQHQALPGLARLTLVLFDDRYEVVADALPVAEVVALDETTYTPRGCTALLDAIGKTVDDLGQRLAASPEPDRPGKVIVAILTDGLENASRRYSLADINQRITCQRETYSWEFLFLGANQDAIATAVRMGIAARDSAVFSLDSVGMLASHHSLGRKSAALRRMAMGDQDPLACADCDSSLSEIVKEEDKKGRGKGKKGKEEGQGK